MVKSFFGFDQNTWSEIASADQRDTNNEAFAQRLITGMAAEQYFESKHTILPEFQGYTAENTTRFGCGYDFRLRRNSDQTHFLAIEVKGLRDMTGTLSLTPKEYDVASALGERFYLFVVRNFRETPTHSIFQNPLANGLLFTKTERKLIQTSWVTSV